MAKQPKAPAEAPKPSAKHIELTAGNVKEHVKTVNATSATLYMVPLEHIQIAPGLNIRNTSAPEYKEAMARLVQSITEEGFYRTKPLAGFVGRMPGSEVDAIFVTDGHRRLEAAKIAVANGVKLEKLPVILKAPDTSGAELTRAIIRENEQLNLTVMEKAYAMRRMLADKMSKEEVASFFNVNTKTVEDNMILFRAPKEVQQLVNDGKVSGTLAIKTLRADETKDKSEAKKKLVDAVAKSELVTPGVKKARVTDASLNNNVPMETHKFRFALVKGAVVPFADGAPYMCGLIGEELFTRNPEQETQIIALQDFSVDVVIRKPRKPKEPKAVKGEKKKRGRPPAVDVPVGVEVDPLTMTGIEATDGLDDLGEDDGAEGEEDDELDGAPDLRALGIVDPDSTDDL